MDGPVHARLRGDELEVAEQRGVLRVGQLRLVPRPRQLAAGGGQVRHLAPRRPVRGRAGVRLQRFVIFSWKQIYFRCLRSQIFSICFVLLTLRQSELGESVPGGGPVPRLRGDGGCSLGRGGQLQQLRGGLGQRRLACGQGHAGPGHGHEA